MSILDKARHLLTKLDIFSFSKTFPPPRTKFKNKRMVKAKFTYTWSSFTQSLLILTILTKLAIFSAQVAKKWHCIFFSYVLNSWGNKLFLLILFSWATTTSSSSWVWTREERACRFCNCYFCCIKMFMIFLLIVKDVPSH